MFKSSDIDVTSTTCSCNVLKLCALGKLPVSFVNLDCMAMLLYNVSHNFTQSRSSSFDIFMKTAFKYVEYVSKALELPIIEIWWFKNISLYIIPIEICKLVFFNKFNNLQINHKDLSRYVFYVRGWSYCWIVFRQDTKRRVVVW